MIPLKNTLPMSRIEAFRRKWKVTESALFGSVIRGDAGPESDVDVLVTFAPDAGQSPFDLVEMKDELKGIFAREVDPVQKSYLRNPFMRHEILRTHEVIYAAGT